MGADDLVGFVAFSGDKDGVVWRGCQAACEADGFCSIGFDVAIGRWRDAGLNLANDGIGIFRAWIVRRHDEHVGEAGGGFAHARAFGAIAVATCPEEDEEASLGDFAKCPADIFDGVRGVGVVDKEGGGGIGCADGFEPAAHGRGGFEDFGEACGRNVGGGGDGGEGGGEIQCVMPSEQVRMDGACRGGISVSNSDFKGGPVWREADGVDPEIGGFAEAVGAAACLRTVGAEVGGKAVSKWVVTLDDGAIWRGAGGGVGNEETAFGGEVGLKGVMVVEVVLRQVCEDGGGEAGTISPVLGEGMGGDLDCGSAAVVVEHSPEEGLQLEWAGCRIVGDFAEEASERIIVWKGGHVVFDGGDEPAGDTGTSQEPSNQVGDGRLAVGSRNAENGEFLRGISGLGAGVTSGGEAGIGDAFPSDGGGGVEGARDFGDNADGTGVDGALDKTGTIRSIAFHGEKGIARTDLFGVGRNHCRLLDSDRREGIMHRVGHCGRVVRGRVRA